MTSFVPVKLAYKLFEPITGADENLSPVIFLHPMGSTKEDWRDIPQIIADRTKRKAYAYDARNHGDSQYTDIFYINFNADDLLYFMDSLAISKAVLIGHSMGGFAAIQATLRQPERVEMIIVEEMHTKRVSKKMFDDMATYIQFWVNGLKNVPKGIPLPHVQSYIIDEFLSKTSIHARKHINIKSLYKSNIQFIKKSDGHYDLNFKADAVIRALKSPSEVSDHVGQFSGPAYFIYGALSPFGVGKEENNIKTFFPKAELIEMKNASHHVHIYFPQEFIDVVSGCLLKHSS